MRCRIHRLFCRHSANLQVSIPERSTPVSKTLRLPKAPYLIAKRKINHMNTLTRTILPLSVGILGVLILNSCSAGIPKGATAVQNFNADKYLGKWFEI